MREEYKRKIDAADIVSFDIFDTLLTRKTVDPRDVFTVARELFNEKSPYSMSDDFYRLRIKAEKTVRIKKSMHTEVSFDEIYEEFGVAYGYSKDFCDTLQKYELEAEHIMLMRDPSTVEIYDYAKAQRKSIIIVSDMYLPKVRVAQLLRENGVDDWDELIVSSDEQVAKFSGSAYARIVGRYPGKRVLHVGDNIHSDKGWAEKFGFDTIHIHTNMEALSFELRKVDRAIFGGDRYRWTRKKKVVSVSDVQFNILSGLAAQYCMRPGVTVPQAVGYSLFGPLLLGFVQWLDEEVRASNTDHVFFLARDGSIMRDAYNAYFTGDAVRNTYMLASRRLLNFPSMYKEDFSVNGIHQIAGGKEAISVAQILRYYHIDPEDSRVKQAVEQVGLSGVETVALGENGDRLRALLLLLEPQILDQAKAEAKEVLGYLGQIGFTTAKRPLICDVGWSGSMQRALTLLTERHIRGTYFGISKNEKSIQLGKTASGYVDMRSGPQAAKFEKMFMLRGLLITESLFTNPDQGTLVGLHRKKDGTYEGVEGEFENDAKERAQVRELHQAALQFISDFAAIPLPLSLRVIRREVALRPLEWTVYHPNDEVAEIFGRIRYTYVVASVPDYVGHPTHDANYYKRKEHRAELRDEYKRSEWKQGFAKNCARLGIPLQVEGSESAIEEQVRAKSALLQEIKLLLSQSRAV